MGIRIVQSDEISVRSGDFGAKLREGTLVLPKSVVNFANLMGEHESDGLLEAMANFRGNLEAALKWSKAERREAVTKLLGQLNGEVSEKTRNFVERMMAEEPDLTIDNKMI